MSKERIAQLPQLQRFVGEILVFNLPQTNDTATFQVTLELGTGYQWETDIDHYGEAVFLVDIVEDTIEDYQQFLVKVDLPFLIYRIDIDRHLVLDYRFGMANRSCPIDLVKTSHQTSRKHPQS